MVSCTALRHTWDQSHRPIGTCAVIHLTKGLVGTYPNIFQGVLSAQAHGAQKHGAQKHGTQAHGAQKHGAHAHGAQKHGAPF